MRRLAGGDSVLEAVGIVVVFGLVVAGAWSELDVISRGTEGSLFAKSSGPRGERRSKDGAFTPQTWIPFIFIAYVLLGLAIALRFPHPHIAWRIAYVALPTVAGAWFFLLRPRKN